MSTTEIEVMIEEPGWSILPDAEALVRRAILAAAGHPGLDADPAGEITVVLADDAAVQALNKQFRAKDKPTNVLSFPGPDEVPEGAPMLIGDVVVAFGVTRYEAETDGKTLADHLTHLVIHGFLHCLGYDHESDAEAEEMEALETAILATLGIADPYAEPAILTGTQ